MKLISLNLWFENCDGVEIDAKNICWMEVSDITKRFQKIMDSQELNVEEVANTFLLILNPEADHYDKECTDYVFNRIRLGKDIVQVKLTYEDNNGNKVEQVYETRWTGKNDYENEAQDAFISKKHELVLKIGDKPIEDYISNEDLFHFERDPKYEY